MEDSLKEFEQRVTELKTKAEGLQSDRLSHQELLKLQVKQKKKNPDYLTFSDSTGNMVDICCAGRI